MIFNIVLRNPVAGRTAIRLLQQPAARYRLNPAHKYDGLLRRHQSSASAPSAESARRQQSELVNKKILQARFQINACKIPTTTTVSDRRREPLPRIDHNAIAQPGSGGEGSGLAAGAASVSSSKCEQPAKPACGPPEAARPTCGSAAGGTDGGAAAGGDGGGGSGSNRNLYLALAAAGALLGGYVAYALHYGKDGDEASGAKAAKGTARGGAGGAKGATEVVKFPASAADIPKHVPYLLIGGGTASFAAFRAIKSADPKAKCLVVTEESQMPYMRPPLSKEMWLSAPDADAASAAAAADASSVPTKPVDPLSFRQWNGKERSLFFEPADFYLDPRALMDSPNGGVAIVRGYSVRHIDVCTRTAVLADGTEIKYDECLLATGSQPRNLDVFASAPAEVKERVTLFRTVADYERLRRSLAGKAKAPAAESKPVTVAVIGGGFLGSELSCALAKYGRERGVRVYQVFRETGNMGRVLPRYLSEWTANRVRDEGVTVVAGTQVEGVRMQDGRVRLQLLNGQDLLVDRVVVAVGSEPDTALAQSSGLEVDGTLGGYVVNAELEARRHLYVAGDAACFFDTKLGRRRVEHHDHAVVSGRLAGENMVGQKKPYKHQSMFWSDIGPAVGFEAIGIVDGRLPTVGVFARATTQDSPAAAASNNLTTDNQQLAANPGDSAAILLAEQQKVAAKSRVVEPRADCGCQDDSGSAEEESRRYGKGVLFYLRDEKVVGVVLWNVFNRINTARAIVNENKKWDDLNELAKLFEIHS